MPEKITIYRADDGEEFNTESEAIQHEARAELRRVLGIKPGLHPRLISSLIDNADALVQVLTRLPRP